MKTLSFLEICSDFPNKEAPSARSATKRAVTKLAKGSDHKRKFSTNSNFVTVTHRANSKQKKSPQQMGFTQQITPYFVPPIMDYRLVLYLCDSIGSVERDCGIIQITALVS